MPPEQVEGMVKQFEADYKGTTVQFMNKYIFVAMMEDPKRFNELLTGVLRDLRK
jgi:hypothetical protein